MLSCCGSSLLQLFTCTVYKGNVATGGSAITRSNNDKGTVQGSVVCNHGSYKQTHDTEIRAEIVTRVDTGTKTETGTGTAGIRSVPPSLWLGSGLVPSSMGAGRAVGRTITVPRAGKMSDKDGNSTSRKEKGADRKETRIGKDRVKGKGKGKGKAVQQMDSEKVLSHDAGEGTILSWQLDDHQHCCPLPL